MKKHYARLVTLVLLFIPISANSEAIKPDAADMLEARIEAFRQSPALAPLRDREVRGEVYIGNAIATVDVGPKNPSWAKHRVLAYEKALVEAQSEFVLSQGVSIRDNTVRSLFARGSNRPPKFNKNDLINNEKYQRILNKAIAWGEGKLDVELEKLGVDPKDFATARKKQRTTMLHDAIEKDTLKKAVGSLVGLFPYKTFEGKTASGDHAIGVLVVYTPKMRRFAHDILNARGNLRANPAKMGRSVFDQINKNKIYVDFGIRRIYDENGNPVLISFGQWANAAKSRANVFESDSKRLL